MREELIKRLRDIASHDSNIESNYIGLALLQAADAIEAMNYEIKSLYKLLGTHPDPRGENGEAGVKCMEATATHKPPIGAKPGWLHAVHRISDLAGAIERYANDGIGEARRILMRRWAEEIMMQLDIWEKLSDVDWCDEEGER